MKLSPRYPSNQAGWNKIVLNGMIVMVLAVGIATTANLFLIVDRTLLRPVPYTKPDLLVELQLKAGAPVYSKKEIADLSTIPVFSAVEAYSLSSITTTGTNGPEQVEGGAATTGLFTMLGMVPASGRLFDSRDGRGETPVAIISHAYWLSAFGGDPAVVGRKIEVMGRRTVPSRPTIIGVLPRDTGYPIGGSAIWLPVTMDPTDPDYQAKNANLHAFGRLKDSITLAQAQPAVTEAVKNWVDQMPAHAFRSEARRRQFRAELDARVVPLEAAASGENETLLWALLGFAALVLAVATANAGNVQVARALSRRKEFATRLALGAHPSRIIRQLLMENLRLGGAAAGLSLLLLLWSHPIVLRSLPVSPARTPGVILDSSVIAFVFFSGLTVSLILTAAATLTSTKRLAGCLGPSISGDSRRGFWIQHSLIAGSVCLTVILTVGAGLMLRTIWNLGSESPGFIAAEVTAISVAPSIQDAAGHHQLFTRLLDVVQAQPAVRNAGLVFSLPLAGRNSFTDIRFENHPELSSADTQLVRFQLASDGYLRAMGLQLLAGRDLNRSDVEGVPKVALVNESLRKKFYPQSSAVGERLAGGITIVGVVSDARDVALNLPPEPRVYFPYQQFSPRPMTLVVQSATALDQIVPLVRAELERLDPYGVITSVSSMDKVVEQSLGERARLRDTLWFFSGLCLLLSGLGVYGTMQSWITNNLREIGIRTAIGGRPVQILGWIARSGAASLTVGAAAGFIVSGFCSPVLAPSLYEVDPVDAINNAGVAILCLGLGSCTIVFSALRVVRFNPARLLRT